MRIIKRCRIEVVFDIEKIAMAVSKAALKDLEDEINRRTNEIASAIASGSINAETVHEFEELQSERKRIRILLRTKNQQISTMIKAFWLNRNRTSDRSNTNMVADQMLMSIPTPPTSFASKCSFGCGGVVIAPAG